MAFKPVRPERLSASVQKLQSLGRSPGLESGYRSQQHDSSLNTVARPRGILTRFPILPIYLGHPEAFKYKEQILICADTITRSAGLSNLGSRGGVWCECSLRALRGRCASVVDLYERLLTTETQRTQRLHIGNWIQVTSTCCVSGSRSLLR